MCRGPECGERRNSRAVYDAMREHVTACNLAASVEFGWQACFGRCSQGPNVLVREILAEEPKFSFAAAMGPRGRAALYNRVDAERGRRIIDEHLLRGTVIREFIEPIAAPVSTRTVEITGGAAATEDGATTPTTSSSAVISSSTVSPTASDVPPKTGL